MSTPVQPVSAGHAVQPTLLAKPALPLIVGVVAILLTAIGILISGPRAVAVSWLIGITFWTGIAIGMLFLILLHHIFDAGWSTVVRRPLEHAMASFKWLALLFLPLLVISWFEPGILWKWMNPAYALDEHLTIGEDPLFLHKASYLSTAFFSIRTILYFGVWIGLAAALRRASFSQDLDGGLGWTGMNRKVAAGGLILGGLTATFAAIDWMKSLEYHWFSTMYGVWFFSGAMRAALAATVLMCLLLVKAGPFRGIFNQAHLYDLGKIQLAFTVFWGYITFSQYFLIWNANIPEETFWYVIRESGNWWFIGLLLVFGYFLVPFLFLLSYKSKTIPARLAFISVWILVVFLIDLYYNILPFKMTPEGIPVNFGISLWDLTSLIGIGAICVWAFIRSFPGAKIIPIRDPRILESVNHHE